MRGTYEVLHGCVTAWKAVRGRVRKGTPSVSAHPLGCISNPYTACNLSPTSGARGLCTFSAFCECCCCPLLREELPETAWGSAALC